jgi:hypothetical protein
MNPWNIVLNYVRTWLIVGLLVVVPDWAFTFIALDQTGSSEEGEEGAGNGIKLIRILWLIRLMRLLRLFKRRRLMQSMNVLIGSQHVGIFANIAKMIVLLLVSNHFIGCLWFALSSTQEKPTTWIYHHGFANARWSYQYAAALHWSITQFTPASMDGQPQNLVERVLCGDRCGLRPRRLLDHVVGSITGSLTQLRTLQEDGARQFWDLRRFLKHHKVDATLGSRLTRFLEYAWQRQCEKLDKDGIKIFRLLSDQLAQELQCELIVPHLKVHGFMDQLHIQSQVTMHRLATSAIRGKMLAPSDNLFIAP